MTNLFRIHRPKFFSFSCITAISFEWKIMHSNARTI